MKSAVLKSAIIFTVILNKAKTADFNVRFTLKSAVCF